QVSRRMGAARGLCHRPRHHLDRRHAKQERRLGCLRRRQYALLPEPHPLCRPRRAARSADRGRKRALPGLPRPGRHEARPSRHRARPRLSAARAGARRVLVRPLGHQLHLRHLVGALRLQRLRRGSAGAAHPQGGGVAEGVPAVRRRLGRGRRDLLEGPQGFRAREHGLADGLGGARPDERRRTRERRRQARRRVPPARPTRRRPLARGLVYGRRFPARLLPALSRLCRLFPGLGARPLPLPPARQFAPGRMGDVAKVGIVVGLPQEAALLKQTLGDFAPALTCMGPGPARAARAPASLIAQGVDALLSFGFAGGLDPMLRPGDIIVGAGTVTPDGRRYETDDALARRLCAAFDATNCPWSAGLVAGVDQVLATADDKSALWSRTHALIVDMESHAVAAAGPPFAILRVVVDPAERALPAAALAALSPGGEVRIPKLIAGLLRRPGDISAVWALAGDNRRARAGLRRAA